MVLNVIFSLIHGKFGCHCEEVDNNKLIIFIPITLRLATKRNFVAI